MTATPQGSAVRTLDARRAWTGQATARARLVDLRRCPADRIPGAETAEADVLAALLKLAQDDREIVLVSEHGDEAYAVAAALARLSQRVTVLQRGMAQWREQDLPRIPS